MRAMPMRDRIIALLRRTERFTRTDNVYLAKNGFFVVLQRIVALLNGFVLYLIVTRTLSPEIFGQYKFYLSLYALFGVVTLSGVETALTRAVASGNEGALPEAFWLKVRAGLLGSLLFGGAALYYLLQGRTDLAAAIALIAVASPLLFASDVWASYLSGKKRFNLYTKIQLAVSMASFAGMALAYGFLRNPLTILAVFLTTTAANLIAYVWTRRMQENARRDPDMVRYGLQLSGLELLGMVANSIDGVIVFHFLGAAPLAFYSLATIPIEQIKGFFKSVQAVAMPKFATADVRELRATLFPKVLLFSATVAAACGLYAICAPLFFTVLFPTYLASVPYSQLYALSIVFAAPAGLITTVFEAKGMRRAIATFNTASYASQIVLLVVGGTFFGLWGVVAARVLTRGVMLIVAVALFFRLPGPKS